MKEMTVKMANMETAYRDGGRREEELRWVASPSPSPSRLQLHPHPHYLTSNFTLALTPILTPTPRRATDGMKQKNKDLDSSQAQLHVATSSLAKEQVTICLTSTWICLKYFLNISFQELTFQLQAQFRVEKEGREKDNRLLKLRCNLYIINFAPP